MGPPGEIINIYLQSYEPSTVLLWSFYTKGQSKILLNAPLKTDGNVFVWAFVSVCSVTYSLQRYC